jgi:hypothetical protein
MNRIIIFLLFIVPITACQQNKDKKFDVDSYTKTKETLAEKEKSNPAKFLKVMVANHKNIIGQTVIKGSISNTASVCWYKDPDLKLSFFSKTGARLTEEIETVYENIGPGKTVKFKTKYFAPKGTDSVFAIVSNAKADTLGK